MKCANCGEIVPEGDRFCGKCGADQSPAAECPMCAHELGADANFCPNCGYANNAFVELGAVPESERGRAIRSLGNQAVQSSGWPTRLSGFGLLVFAAMFAAFTLNSYRNISYGLSSDGSPAMWLLNSGHDLETAQGKYVIAAVIGIVGLILVAIGGGGAGSESSPMPGTSEVYDPQALEAAERAVRGERGREQSSEETATCVCGYALDDDDVFCPSCGQNVQVTEVDPGLGRIRREPAIDSPLKPSCMEPPLRNVKSLLLLAPAAGVYWAYAAMPYLTDGSAGEESYTLPDMAKIVSGRAVSESLGVFGLSSLFALVSIGLVVCGVIAWRGRSRVATMASVVVAALGLALNALLYSGAQAGDVNNMLVFGPASTALTMFLIAAIVIAWVTRPSEER